MVFDCDNYNFTSRRWKLNFHTSFDLIKIICKMLVWQSLLAKFMLVFDINFFCLVSAIHFQTLTFIIFFYSPLWQPSPVFLPGKSYGQRSLVGYRPQHRKELDMTERQNNNETLNFAMKILFSFFPVILFCRLYQKQLP